MYYWWDMPNEERKEEVLIMKRWNNGIRFILRLFALLVILVISAVSCLSLCGFSNVKCINDFAYVLAIGLDKGTTGPLRLTFQIAVPTTITSSSGDGASQDSSITTVECSSIEAGINILNDYLSKEVTLRHCKVLVFSEELVSESIFPYLNSLFNDVDLRPTCSVFISRSDTTSFLTASGTHFQGLTAKSYELTSESIQYNGYIANSRLGTFFSSIHDTFSQGFATLVSVNNSDTIQQTSDLVPSLNAIGTDFDANHLAGESTINRNQNSAEHLGIAVFQRGQFVGELTAIETLCHLFVTNHLREAHVSIPDPLQNDQYLDVLLSPRRKTKTKVKIVNGSPFIEVDIALEAKLLSINSKEDYSKDEITQLIEEYATRYFEQNTLEYLYTTAKIYQADIAGFGSKAASHFLFWEDWLEYDWLNRYQDSFFQVNVDFQVHSSSFLQRIS